MSKCHHHAARRSKHRPRVAPRWPLGLSQRRELQHLTAASETYGYKAQMKRLRELSKRTTVAECLRARRDERGPHHLKSCSRRVRHGGHRSNSVETSSLTTCGRVSLLPTRRALDRVVAASRGPRQLHATIACHRSRLGANLVRRFYPVCGSTTSNAAKSSRFRHAPVGGACRNRVGLCGRGRARADAG